MTLPTLVIVEDQQLLRLGLKIHLESLNCCSVIGEAGDGETAIREILRLRPDVVLLDLGLPGVDGVEVTWRVKQELPRIRIVIFTSHTDAADVTAALGAGADGYCTKDAPIEQIGSAIAAVSRGEVWLDPTIAEVVVATSQQQNENKEELKLSTLESNILSLIGGHVDHGQIAQKLGIDSSSVENILRNLLSRLGNKKPAPDDDLLKQRTRLNDWFTAFVEQIDTGKIFAEKYLLQEMIGSGGLGAVFKAKHIYIDRTVALKFLHPEVVQDPLAMRCFQREATAIANVQHSNIVTIYDFGISATNDPFLVMEFISGPSLADILQDEGKLPISHALNLSIQICEGLAAAHESGVVHCDLKPANILIRRENGKEIVKLVDFGLVQLLPRQQVSPQNQLTNKYFICGTPLYMSPEQCAGKPVDARTDIYSFGCMLFELITGEPVFAGDTPMELFAKHLEVEPQSIANVTTAPLPDGLAELIGSMLKKQAEQRPKSMQMVGQSLKEMFTRTVSLP
ncbi:MAG: protein kinase [Cyanobacteria bacterium SZAS-4]|nr:protein kinase [Cyanobacteria bacterium SZAS-4]